MAENEIRGMVNFHAQGEVREKWNIKEIGEIARALFGAPEEASGKLKEMESQEAIADYLVDLAKRAYDAKEKEFEAGNPPAGATDEAKAATPPAMRQVEKLIYLRSLDMLWMDHLDEMDHLRDSVRLRVYGQRDPLVEYKNEGIKLFQRLLAAIQSTATNMIFKVSLGPAQSASGHVHQHEHEHSHEQSHPAAPTGENKIGRNDPCPCNSGLKYKKCHGR